MNNPLEKELIKFAEENPEVNGITKGKDPEKDFVVYWFLVKKNYTPKFSDDLGKLDIEINKQGYDCSLAELPLSANTLLQPYFLGTLIWKRN